MNEAVLQGETTVAIILGADDWSRSGLGSSEAFANSANAIRNYLLDTATLHLPRSNLLDLFNDNRDASAQVTVIGRFLRTRIFRNDETSEKITDVLIYYTGHGALHQSSNEYFLLVKNTEAGFEYATGLHFRYLADCLSQQAAFLRKYIILDCCFAVSGFPIPP